MNITNDFKKRSRITDVGRWYVTRFVRENAVSLPLGSRVLDAGAGECVYKEYFSHCRYFAVDMAIGDSSWNYSNLDCIGRLDNLPFGDNVFDVVICTQVLEHVADPALCLSEMYRVLKRGGSLILTAPMAHAEHQQPYDYFRYTSYGLVLLCSRTGFSETVVRPFGGIFIRWAYELPQIIKIFPTIHRKDGSLDPRGIVAFPFKIVCRLLILALQIIMLNLDRLDTERAFPFGWAVMAHK